MVLARHVGGASPGWSPPAPPPLMLAALAAARALPRRELDPVPVKRHPVLHEMAQRSRRAADRSPYAVCFGAYACCWFAVIGFPPTLQVERLGFSTSTAAIVTAVITIVNVGGNLAAGWLMRHGLTRVVLIVGAALVDGVLCRRTLRRRRPPISCGWCWRALYSAVIGVVPAALFTALAVHAPRPELVGASTGLLMQGSNIGSLARSADHRRAGCNGRLAAPLHG